MSAAIRPPVRLKYMILPPRLKAIADRVPEGTVLADIGCDHGYLPIALLQRHRITKAIASDIAEGPLKQAKENMQRYQAKNKVELRLSDGFKEFQPGEAETAVIAGMGGMQIRDILLNAPEGVLDSIKTLLLQPQTEIDEVRKVLHHLHFMIVDECFVIDRGKHYTIIQAVHGEETYEDPRDYTYGRLLIQRKDPLYMNYLAERARDLEKWADAAEDPFTAKSLREEAEWIQKI